MTGTARSRDLPIGEEFRELLEPLTEEVSVDALAIDGQLPTWLTGTLVRNGPAYFGPVRHLFDGLAMLHKFAFTDGRVSYANRFLRTRAHQALREDGRIGYREFASDPCRRMTAPIASLFRPGYTDNANVNVIRMGNQLAALTETPLPVAFDLDTLATLGVAYDPPGRGVRSPTAHPHLDTSGAMITTQVHYGPRSSYRIFRRHATGFHQIARLSASEPAYLQQFRAHRAPHRPGRAALHRTPARDRQGTAPLHRELPLAPGAAHPVPGHRPTHRTSARYLGSRPHLLLPPRQRLRRP